MKQIVTENRSHENFTDRAMLFLTFCWFACSFKQFASQKTYFLFLQCTFKMNTDDKQCHLYLLHFKAEKARKKGIVASHLCIIVSINH